VLTALLSSSTRTDVGLQTRDSSYLQALAAKSAWADRSQITGAPESCVTYSSSLSSQTLCCSDFVPSPGSTADKMALSQLQVGFAQENDHGVRTDFESRIIGIFAFQLASNHVLKLPLSSYTISGS